LRSGYSIPVFSLDGMVGVLTVPCAGPLRPRYSGFQDSRCPLLFPGRRMIARKSEQAQAEHRSPRLGRGWRCLLVRVLTRLRPREGAHRA
jgi:hypothetical protein